MKQGAFFYIFFHGNAFFIFSSIDIIKTNIIKFEKLIRTKLCESNRNIVCSTWFVKKYISVIIYFVKKHQAKP